VGLCVQHIQRRALADIPLFDDAAQRELSRRYKLAACRHHLLRGDILRPSRRDRLPHTITSDINLDAGLAERFFRLPYNRRGTPALINRNGEVQTDRGSLRSAVTSRSNTGKP